MADPVCRICGAAALGSAIPAREMLHGTRETFDYVECAACGCVQIASIPTDLSRHYPNDYFSFRSHRDLDVNRVRRFVDPRRVKVSFGGRDWIGALAEKVSRPFDYVDWVRRAGLGPEARVLDVGCGAGKTLLNLALGGFPEPQGVDPFVERTLRYRCGVTVHKQSLRDYARETSRRFDLIMFHHSLEHLVDPREALETASGLLATGGRMLIAVPVAGSWAWRHYSADWCNLDAPRHIHLFTGPAMEILAWRAGLKIVEARSVGRLSQFTGSERYRRDIPANDRRRDRDLFTRSELSEWRRRTEQLNREGQGDQTMFFLAPA